MKTATRKTLSVVGVALAILVCLSFLTMCVLVVYQITLALQESARQDLCAITTALFIVLLFALLAAFLFEWLVQKAVAIWRRKKPVSNPLVVHGKITPAVAHRVVS